jgi:hypothetical protein
VAFLRDGTELEELARHELISEKPISRGGGRYGMGSVAHGE